MHEYPGIFVNEYGLVFEKIRVHTWRIPIVLTRPHGNAETMEIQRHPFQGMRCVMYEIIVFDNMRFRPFTRKR